jgi:hypothetical protein
MKKILYPATFLCLILACKSEKKQSDPVGILSQSIAESMIKPILGLESAPIIFEVPSNEPSTIQLPNGGTIAIPKDAFIDKNGHSIEGLVNIEWKEYHTLTDILVSGIPMKYDSLGVQYDFVSAGMFTISANQDGKSVDLRAGKPTAVNLTSYDETPCYNFYKLDEKTGDWAYKTTKEATPIRKEVVKKEPVIIDAQVDITAFPELKKKQIVGWKSLDELTIKEKKIIKKLVSDITLMKENDVYVLQFNGSSHSTCVHVEPLLMDEVISQKAKLEKELLEDYTELLVFQQNVSEGKVIRSIEIDNFGTYNWDIKYKRKNSKNLVAIFDHKPSINPKYVSVFLISPDENMIVKYNSDQDNNFSFDPEKRNCLVAIMPDNHIYTVNDRAFDQARKASTKSPFTFHFKDTEKIMKNGHELGAELLSMFNTTN